MIKKKRQFIPLDEVIKEWDKDPEFMKEYEALGEEFALEKQRIYECCQDNSIHQEIPDSE